MSSDPAAGQKDTLKLGCIACHSFNQGGKAGLGPNLYGVVGGPHAHMPGFQYSAALKAHAGPWTYDELDKWLTKPSAYAPGTKMSFAGICQPQGAGGRDRLFADERGEPGAAARWRYTRGGDGGPRRSASRARTRRSRTRRWRPSRAPAREIALCLSLSRMRERESGLL